jgi:hypothetical protein
MLALTLALSQFFLAYIRPGFLRVYQKSQIIVNLFCLPKTIIRVEFYIAQTGLTQCKIVQPVGRNWVQKSSQNIFGAGWTSSPGLPGEKQPIQQTEVPQLPGAAFQQLQRV